jgi:hypothetical protein
LPPNTPRHDELSRCLLPRGRGTACGPIRLNHVTIVWHLKEARVLLTDPEITVENVARRLGVGPSTLYRYLPTGPIRRFLAFFW